VVKKTKIAALAIDFLAAAEYPDLPNFCCRRKSAGKIAAP